MPLPGHGAGEMTSSVPPAPKPRILGFAVIMAGATLWVIATSRWSNKLRP